MDQIESALNKQKPQQKKHLNIIKNYSHFQSKQGQDQLRNRRASINVYDFKREALGNLQMFSQQRKVDQNNNHNGNANFFNFNIATTKQCQLKKQISNVKYSDHALKSINQFLNKHQNELIELSANQNESQRSKSISATDFNNSISKSTFSNINKSQKKVMNEHPSKFVSNRSMNLLCPARKFSKALKPSRTQKIIKIKFSSNPSYKAILQNPEINQSIQPAPDSGSTNNVIQKNQDTKNNDEESDNQESSSELKSNEQNSQEYDIFDIRNKKNIRKMKSFKKRNKELKVDLANTKTFLNMVIHDLRNPTSQINFTIKFAIDYLKNQNEIKNNLIQELKEFIEKLQLETFEIIENLKYQNA